MTAYKILGHKMHISRDNLNCDEQDGHGPPMADLNMKHLQIVTSDTYI